MDLSELQEVILNSSVGFSSDLEPQVWPLPAEGCSSCSTAHGATGPEPVFATALLGAGQQHKGMGGRIARLLFVVLCTEGVALNASAALRGLEP